MSEMAIVEAVLNDARARVLDPPVSDLAVWSDSSLKGKLILVKVGSDERPAGPDDIQQVKLIFQKALNSLFSEEVDRNNFALICSHHLVEVEVLDLEKSKIIEPE